jgi:hypothetical protein
VIKPFSQKARLGLLFVDVGLLLIASRLGFGQFVPTNDDRGFWFYSALLGLLLGSRLDTPFFVTPADVILYTAPAGIALSLASNWPAWPSETRASFVAALGFCTLCLLLGAIAVLTHGAKNQRLQRTSNACRILAETLGTPRVVYSVVVVFALFAFHRNSTREFACIASVWILTSVLSPLEGAWLLVARLRRVFDKGAIAGQDGEVVAFQTPGLLLIRQTQSRTIARGAVLAVRDIIGSIRIAIALDQVGRDDGILIRALELSDIADSTSLLSDVIGLDQNGVVCLPEERAAKAFPPDHLIRIATVVGLVAPDTSIERLYFEVVADDELEEGRLVEVQVRAKPVLYQIVNGLTREEVIRQRNTHGFARAQAQKVGIWNSKDQRFTMAKWLPRPNAPVFLRAAAFGTVSRGAIGYFPGTDHPVRLKSVASLVTHNTAILGILGVGKSSLAFELIERILASRTKVICIDITGEYESQLAPFIDSEKQKKSEEVLQAAAKDGKTNYQQNVQEGGSREAFATKLRDLITAFVAPKNETTRLLVLNPSKYDVWRQDSKIYNNRASMASVSPAEITQMISEAALDTVAGMGITDTARLCVVYEEAHALIPEWNSTTNEGDRAASNGTARAILQGRKYGMGCILITQRTANVTKTILNQCNTVFAMRTFDDTGKGFLANYVGSEYADTLPSLSERHAIFFGRASDCENPVLVRLNDRLDFIAAFREADVVAGVYSPIGNDRQPLVRRQPNDRSS